MASNSSRSGLRFGWCGCWWCSRTLKADLSLNRWMRWWTTDNLSMHHTRLFESPVAKFNSFTVDSSQRHTSNVPVSFRNFKSSTLKNFATLTSKGRVAPTWTLESWSSLEVDYEFLIFRSLNLIRRKVYRFFYRYCWFLLRKRRCELVDWYSISLIIELIKLLVLPIEFGARVD